MLLFAALVAAAFPPIPASPGKDVVSAEQQLLKASARELKKKQAWPLAKGQVVIVRAEGKKGEPALVLVRGNTVSARIACVVLETGDEAKEPNAIAERVWSFTGGEGGMNAVQRFQLPAQLSDGKLEAGARGDLDNHHSAVFFEPQAEGARILLGSCALKGQ